MNNLSSSFGHIEEDFSHVFVLAAAVYATGEAECDGCRSVYGTRIGVTQRSRDSLGIPALLGRGLDNSHEYRHEISAEVTRRDVAEWLAHEEVCEEIF